jgi:hypothetical protein
MTDNFQEDINAYLESFQQNPVELMNKQPSKMDARDDQEEQAIDKFDDESIADKDYVTARDMFRERVYRMEEIAPGRAAYRANDRAEDLVDDFMYSGLEIMEQNVLMDAELDTSPWSDDYWPIYKGILGNRYADPDFPASKDWKRNFDYVQQRPASDIIDSGQASVIDRLSPSEKYDAIIGDENETLTRRMWSQGKYYYEATGKVAAWMGICHGWAPAAYMLPRPTGTTIVPTPSGHGIIFYPSDIKALASLLWAKVRTPTRFIGGRCNDKNPDTDPNTGRVISNKCFDTNPGSWHLSVVNQIGASKRSFVMDATYDYEVWNQPIKEYTYRYFNPKLMRYKNSLSDAKVRMSEFNNDQFHNYRGDAASEVVGIAMRVAYIVETRPNHNAQDDDSHDKIKMVTYYYDLELDPAGKIIGGEWYTNRHPDFLWTSPPNIKARTSFDHLVSGAWSKNEPLPAGWKHAAHQSAQADGAPLAAIVENLIYQANG